MKLNQSQNSHESINTQSDKICALAPVLSGGGGNAIYLAHYQTHETNSKNPRYSVGFSWQSAQPCHCANRKAIRGNLKNTHLSLQTFARM